jgi:hypothetical protein
MRVTEANATAFRASVLAEIFSGDGLPSEGTTPNGTISTGVTNPLTALGVTIRLPAITSWLFVSSVTTLLVRPS